MEDFVEDQPAMTRAPASCDSLQKEISRREAFERKNAELERVNDELRLENGELREQMLMLRKRLEEMAAKPKSSSGSSSASNTPEGQKKHHKSKQSSQKQHSGSTPVHGANNDSHEEEVHTLRKEKKALKDELEQTITKQMNFEAAFKTEFDLRTTIEEKYDSLRERYERLVIENDELRRLLCQHSILLPPPPSIRARSRTKDGPMKPPRRNKRSVSLQPDTRPKSELVATFYQQEYPSQSVRPVSASYHARSLSPLQTSDSSPSEHHQFVYKDLKTIEGSCEITATESSQAEKIAVSNKDTGSKKSDQYNGQPLDPKKTPTSEVRKFQSRSLEYLAGNGNHKRNLSGSTAQAVNSESVFNSVTVASELTGQSETSKLNGIGVTITVSTEADIVAEESGKDAGQNSKHIETNTMKLNESATAPNVDDLNQESRQLEESHEEATVLPKDGSLEENTKTADISELELDNLMATSAQQLESAKAFYAEMHAHLKDKQKSDNESD